MATFQINGIGVRDLHRTVSGGLFICANDHCKGKRDGAQQEYKLVSSRSWFTFLWIPLIPLGGRRAYAQCKSCKATYSPSAVAGAS